MYNAQGELKCDADAQKKKTTSAFESFWQSSENIVPAAASKSKGSGDDIEDFWQQTTLQTLDALKAIKPSHKRHTIGSNKTAPEGFCGGSTCGFHQ